MYDVTLYPRGFVFYPADYTVPETAPTAAFERMDLPGGASVDIEELADRDVVRDSADWVVLIGLGLLFDPVTGTVRTDGLAESLLTAAHEDPQEMTKVEDLLYEMGGRYCVLLHVQGKTRIYHDAHGGRTVYWRTDSGVVSSHFDILERLREEVPNPHPLSRLTIGGRWEHTRDANIRALLPNHRLELEERNERRFFPFRNNPFMGWTAEEKAREIGRIWHAQLDAVLALGRPNVMSVTAGIDSRLLLSFVKGQEEQFDAFTYGPLPGSPQESKFKKSLKLDLERADRIASAMGLRHRSLYLDSEKLKHIDSDVLDRNSIHIHGRYILPLYLESFPDRRTLFYRGNLVETVRAHLGLPPGKDWHRAVEKFLLATSIRDMKSDELAICAEATREEMKRFEDPVISSDYQITDLAYWEVRMGRFISEVSNETDIAFDVWMPINQRRLLDLFLAFPFSERQDESSMFQVIDQEYPLLNSFDLNSYPSMEARTRLYEEEKSLIERAAGRPTDRQVWRSPAGEETVYSPEGPMALDEHTYVAGSAMRREWEFSRERGAARLVFRNRWAARRGAGYMKIEVGVGDQTLRAVDMSESALAEVVEIPEAVLGDRIWIELKPLRTMGTESWFRASVTDVLAYEETGHGD
ncbi:hypothetical protein [Rothia halotolerans]|uniref:hypothetical protein n=1 Tax=Rothia halotolerans TaxID=405770 RepID=UPI00101B6B14|nr:hypothetical protein [Rothia halotolerans]